MGDAFPGTKMKRAGQDTANRASAAYREPSCQEQQVPAAQLNGLQGPGSSWAVEKGVSSTWALLRESQVRGLERGGVGVYIDLPPGQWVILILAVTEWSFPARWDEFESTRRKGASHCW